MIHHYGSSSSLRHVPSRLTRHGLPESKIATLYRGRRYVDVPAKTLERELLVERGVKTNADMLRQVQTKFRFVLST
jgi:hypothetical protein